MIKNALKKPANCTDTEETLSISSPAIIISVAETMATKTRKRSNNKASSWLEPTGGVLSGRRQASRIHEMAPILDDPVVIFTVRFSH